MVTNEAPSTPDPWESTPENNLDQHVIDSSGAVVQQSVLGNNNTQTQSQQDCKQVTPDLQENESPDASTVSQQAAAGNNNNQNIVNVIIRDSSAKSRIPSGKQRSEGSQQLEDLTKPLSQKPGNLPEVKLDELSAYCKKLYEDSLIIVACPDSRTALSVAYSLADQIDLPSKRQLTGELESLKQLEIELSIENLILNPKINEGEPSLIIIDTYEMQPFLDSLVVRDLTSASFKQDLSNQKRLCICLASSQALKTTIKTKGIKLSFPHWEIPFEQEEASHNEQKETIAQSIAPYEDKQTAISLYEAADTLKKTVLYVATFFKNLNINDFDRIVSLLLSKQTTSIEVKPVAEPKIAVFAEEEHLTDKQPQKAEADKVINLPEVQIQRLLRDIWEEESDQILNDCFLELRINEHASRVIDFSKTNLRNDLIEYFRVKKFVEYRNKFRKLAELDLLFDASPQVAEALRDLSIAMMLFQPDINFWVNWLEKTVLETLPNNKSKEKRQLNYTYYCITNLLRKTSDHSELEDFTKKFLNRFFSSDRHYIVLALAKRLRSAPQFDEYDWLKQCIHRGSESVREESGQIIYNQMTQSGSRIYEILEKINIWLPELQSVEPYKPSQHAALRLFYKYILETLGDFDETLYGDRVFNYSLFGGLSSSESESIDVRLDMIVKWVLHPGINSILVNDNQELSDFNVKNEEDDVGLGVASMIIFPSLFNILFGLKEEVNVQPKFLPIANSLMRSIKKVTEDYEINTNKRYRVIITQYWRLLSRVLLDASNEAIRKHKKFAYGENLNYRRNIIDYLIEQIEA